jgi:hypothetical protein
MISTIVNVKKRIDWCGVVRGALNTVFVIRLAEQVQNDGVNGQITHALEMNR